jgi:hypothetical protein
MERHAMDTSRLLVRSTPGGFARTATLLLLAASLAAVSSDPAGADSEGPVSRHLETLRTHESKIEAACAPIERLAGWRLPAREDLAPLARRLLDTTVSFRAAAGAFVDSRTRRGLWEELDIVSRGCARLSGAARLLRQVSAVELPGAALSGWDKTLDTSVRLAHGWLMFEVTQELIAKGPGALLEAKSFEDIQAKAWERMEQALERFRRRLDQRVQKLDRYFAPLELLEAEGLSGFVQIKAREEVRRLAASLVVNLSPSGLVVRIAGDIIYRIAIDLLWPKLRELFRQKGNLDARVAQSLETLEQSRRELNELGARGDSTEVKLDDVRTVVARAHGRLAAMRFLERDVQRGRHDELMQKMSTGVTHLQRAIRLTEKRFLLDRVTEIQTLRPRVAQLGALARGIQRLLLALAQTDPTARRGFYVHHSNMAAGEGPQAGSAERPSVSPTPSLFANLHEIDLARRAQFLEQHLRAGGDPAAFDQTSGAFAKSYDQPHLLEATCEGQTRYLYRLRGRGGTTTSYGSGLAHGLSDGRHRVQLTVYTAEGQELYFEYTIVVRRGRRAQRAERNLDRGQEGLKRARKGYDESSDDEERRQRLRALAGFEARHAALLHEAGATPGERVTELLASALEHIAQVGPELNPRSSLWGHLFRTCLLVGDAASLEIYTRAWALLAPSLTKQPRDRARVTIDREVDLAHLTISATADILGARKHLESAVRAQEAGALDTNTPDWKQHWYDNFPQPFGGSGLRGASR